MKYDLKMPDLATTGSAIKIVRWLKQAGQPVKRGEFILEIETDKAAMEMESSVEGILRETKVDPGSEVAAGDIIAILEITEAIAPVAQSVRPPTTSALSDQGPSPSPATPAGEPAGMFARNRAAAAARSPSADQATTKPAALTLSPARRTAARRLQESKQSIPHFYLQTSANAASLIARREAAPAPKPAWDAFFVQAASKALQLFERMNYRYENHKLVPQNTRSIGIAVDPEYRQECPELKPTGKILAELSVGILSASDA